MERRAPVPSSSQVKQESPQVPVAPVRPEDRICTVLRGPIPSIFLLNESLFYLQPREHLCTCSPGRTVRRGRRAHMSLFLSPHPVEARFKLKLRGSVSGLPGGGSEDPSSRGIRRIFSPSGGDVALSLVCTLSLVSRLSARRCPSPAWPLSHGGDGGERRSRRGVYFPL